MATQLAILATAKAIQRLLTDACPKSDFPTAEFKIVQAGDIAGANPQFEGISIYLYHITANISRRDMTARVSPSGKRTRPPLPLDLHFLLTPWSINADTQLRLLGWAMRVLENSPIIPASYLNNGFPGKEVFRHDETVELFFDPIPMQDMALLWEDLHQVRIMPSITYIVRMVQIESEENIDEGKFEQTHIMNIAKDLK
jgi:hypothetical protein